MPISNPVDIRLWPGIDLLTKAGRDKVDRIIEADDPFAVTLAPVCTMWGNRANMMQGASRERMLRERERWDPVVNWVFDVAEKRLARGRKVLIEHPWASAMWRQHRMRKRLEKGIVDASTLEEFEVVRGDQCQYGLRDERSGLPHEKATGFATASAPLKTRLSRRCMKDHVHQHLE